MNTREFYLYIASNGHLRTTNRQGQVRPDEVCIRIQVHYDDSIFENNIPTASLGITPDDIGGQLQITVRHPNHQDLRDILGSPYDIVGHNNA